MQNIFCPGGGIGRHTSLRGWRSFGHASSSLVLGTHLKKEWQMAKVKCCVYWFCHFLFSNGFWHIARMAELVDALVSGTSIRKDVQVRVLFRAPIIMDTVLFKRRCLFVYCLYCVWKRTVLYNFETKWRNILNSHLLISFPFHTFPVLYLYYFCFGGIP